MRLPRLPQWTDRLPARLRVRGVALVGVAALGAGTVAGPYDPHQPLSGPPGLAQWPAAVAAVAPGVAAPDPVTAPPQRVAAFFAGLTAAQGEALAAADPGVVGNTDGVPLALRYAANARAQARDGVPVRPLLG